MPLRIAKPWLLLDWVYKLTETASNELNQKRKLDEFTRTVCDRIVKENRLRNKLNAD